MVCEKMQQELLQDYLEGIIDPVEKIFVESHLSICKQCRRELSELKLVFWELCNKDNYEVQYPRELDTMGAGMIDKILNGKPRSSTRIVIDSQVDNIRMTGNFFKYVPGAKQTPQILKKASKGLVKGVKKMLTAK